MEGSASSWYMIELEGEVSNAGPQLSVCTNPGHLHTLCVKVDTRAQCIELFGMRMCSHRIDLQSKCHYLHFTSTVPGPDHQYLLAHLASRMY